MEHDKLTVLLNRLFDEISLLGDQGRGQDLKAVCCFATVGHERLVWSSISQWMVMEELRLGVDDRF